MKKISLVVFSLTFLLFPLKSWALQTSYTESCNINLSRTDWTQSCEIKRFDGNRGELKKVNVEFYSYIEGIVKVENKDAQSKNVSTSYQANIKFNKEDGTTVSEVPLKLGYSEIFNSFDGSVDYTGSSGKTSPKQTNDSSKSAEYNSGSDFDRFKGSGSLRYTASTSGNMTVTGSSNAAADWDTFAKSQVKVTYTYEGKDLSIRKTHSGSFYKPNDFVEFSLIVTNEDDQDFSGTIYIKDFLPGNLRYDSFSPNNWSCSLGGNTVNCSINQNLSSKASTTLKLKFKISDSASGTITNNAEVSTSGDSNQANNKTTDWIIIGTSTPVIPSRQPVAQQPQVLGVCSESSTYSPVIKSTNISADTAKILLSEISEGESCDKIEVQYGNCLDGLKNKKVFNYSDLEQNTLVLEGLLANQNYNFRVRCLSSCASSKFSPISSAITNPEDDSCPKIYTNNLQIPEKDLQNSSCQEKNLSNSKILGESNQNCPEIKLPESNRWFWLPYFLSGFVFGVIFTILLGKIKKNSQR